MGPLRFNVRPRLATKRVGTTRSTSGYAPGYSVKESP
jgi:hypothetical protein